jgi:hypothetical protein
MTIVPSIFLPRGIRNNNPGNIRLSKTAWQGQKSPQADPEFVEFMSPAYGLRALMKTLLTYHLKYGLDTVESVLNRWAPPYENDTDRYVIDVARVVKVKRTEKINLTSKPVLMALAGGIALHENGRPPPDRPPGWYGADIYEQAAAMALSSIA